MTDSQRLLTEYVANGSEMAFRELVSRYVDLVYSSALRLVEGDRHHAEDVAQTVFADLARTARTLSKDVMLGGWLHRHTCFVASKTMRGERRRQIRERQAAEMNVQDYSEANLAQVAPILDEAINQLGAADRTAVLLRFFEQQDFRSVGEALGSNEDAARMRVTRALEKLHLLLKHRGVTFSAAALGAALASQAVIAAPAGLAVSISSAALAAATGTATSLTILKFIAMTKVQTVIIGAIVVVGAAFLVVQHQAQVKLDGENQSLRQQIAQLQTDNESLSNRAAQPGALRLSLPAPRVQVSTLPATPVADWRSTDLIARMQRGEKAPTLTPGQAEKYLDENHRTAASLLAAFRATGDQKLLKEATEKYPDDPQVAFTAACAPGASSDEQRRWLDAFKQSAPENALPNYLSALNHFKAGQTEQAVQDLSAASAKTKFQDYSWDFIQNGEEAYRAAGYSEVEARVIPSMALVLPQLAELKQLNGDMIDLAMAYRQAGDESSAQAALQMDAALGQRLSGPGNTALITQLVGMAIESLALKQMDPTSPYGNGGQTVKDRLDEITQRKTGLTEFANQLDGIYASISAPDWISYHDRWQAFGEDNAVRWLLNKYGQK